MNAKLSIGALSIFALVFSDSGVATGKKEAS